VVGKRGNLGVIAIHDPVGAAVQRGLLTDEGVVVSDRGTIALARYGWLPTARKPTPERASARADRYGLVRVAALGAVVPSPAGGARPASPIGGGGGAPPGGGTGWVPEPGVPTSDGGTGWRHRRLLGLRRRHVIVRIIFTSPGGGGGGGDHRRHLGRVDLRHAGVDDADRLDRRRVDARPIVAAARATAGATVVALAVAQRADAAARSTACPPA
jgi:hypothetical protein